jgi:hypothetical protein
MSGGILMIEYDQLGTGLFNIHLRLQPAKTLKMGLRSRPWGGITDHSDGRVTHMSRPGNGNWKAVGSTPMIVYGVEFSVTVLPAIIGSPPNRFRHNSALIIVTLCPPGVSSSDAKLRPSIGSTPRVRRKFADACRGDD